MPLLLIKCFLWQQLYLSTHTIVGKTWCLVKSAFYCRSLCSMNWTDWQDQSPWVVLHFSWTSFSGWTVTVWSQSPLLMSRVHCKAKRSSQEWCVTLSSCASFYHTYIGSPWQGSLRPPESLNEVNVEVVGMSLRSLRTMRGWKEK